MLELQVVGGGRSFAIGQARDPNGNRRNPVTLYYREGSH